MCVECHVSQTGFDSSVVLWYLYSVSRYLRWFRGICHVK